MQLYIYDSAWVWIIVFMKISILMSDCKSFCWLPLLIAQFPLLTAASPSDHHICTGGGLLPICWSPASSHLGLCTNACNLWTNLFFIMVSLLKSGQLPWEVDLLFFLLLRNLTRKLLDMESGGTQIWHDIIYLGKSCALHVNCSPPGSCVWTLGPQLVARFGVVELLGSILFIQAECHWAHLSGIAV